MNRAIVSNRILESGDRILLVKSYRKKDVEIIRMDFNKAYQDIQNQKNVQKKLNIFYGKTESGLNIIYIGIIKEK
jgi:hypothetical protein